MVNNLNVPADSAEHRDPPALIQSKIQALALLIRGAQRVVVYTGAGISTSAGIPDFCGPQGVWTRQEEGIDARVAIPDTTSPTPAHMALVRLVELGKVSLVVSQNMDGLHLRSGIPPARLAELHGNRNVEVCTLCGMGYFRRFSCRSEAKDHQTGRRCDVCAGPLRDSIVQFGESLPHDAWARSVEESKRADLGIVLGSSLLVSPASDVPLALVRAGTPLAIVNLQRTPLDASAALRLGAPTDAVMAGVLRALGEDVPAPRDVSAELEERTRRAVGLAAARADAPHDPAKCASTRPGPCTAADSDGPDLFLARRWRGPAPVVAPGGGEEWAVEKIVDARRRGRGWQYRVRWAGYDEDDDSWLPRRDLEDTKALDDWLAVHPH
ncbi:DHS-like NAD/FAD-binding domain-containing protein [Gloeophyllum trabeum ATCC 11539]|uniref:protein acetyllysine N-acetyltransferase n=1 Tax=Gloeophyllum trabeum (strain ATCC 11539 / FP-39264 / Madison 617) TaxID=670483 RepID=S7PVN2_GLOTA|nr:DHS-like NAD/FAD-binding domain-containing protein [Gloeophyllum trabeum ATCC 11539]EPQ51432.1 DHS-like NAD/FAD-binding domain-containing protein [Gloeophyllum trabeum ATCC 11539]